MLVVSGVSSKAAVTGLVLLWVHHVRYDKVAHLPPSHRRGPAPGGSVVFTSLLWKSSWASTAALGFLHE